MLQPPPIDASEQSSRGATDHFARPPALLGVPGTADRMFANKTPREAWPVCDAEASTGHEVVLLGATSIVVAGHARVLGTARTVPDIPHAAEVSVDVIGRVVHGAGPTKNRERR